MENSSKMTPLEAILKEYGRLMATLGKGFAVGVFLPVAAPTVVRKLMDYMHNPGDDITVAKGLCGIVGGLSSTTAIYAFGVEGYLPLVSLYVAGGTNAISAGYELIRHSIIKASDGKKVLP